MLSVDSHKMEFGRVTRIKSKYLNDSVVVYNSVKHPGNVYKFSRKKDNEYHCCRCRKLGKQRFNPVTRWRRGASLQTVAEAPVPHSAPLPSTDHTVTLH